MAATKAAVEEGIVPGGGVTYIRARKTLQDLKKTLATDDEKMGVDILYSSLAMLVRMIARNAGADDGWVLKTIEDNKILDFGFNALINEFEPMLAAGIVDPTKVSRLALQNAASIATMILTTECLITDIPEKNPSTGSGPMPGGGMGGMGGGMDY